MSDTRPHVAVSAHLLHGATGYRSAGIHTYIAHLLEHLTQVDEGFRYTIYTNANPVVDAHIRSTRLPTARPMARIAWEQLLQPFALHTDQPDLLHVTAFVAPLLSRRLKVVTVYDLSFELFPEYFHGPNQLYLRAFTRLSLRRASRVITISHNTRHDIHRRYGIALERIDVARPGVDARFRPLPCEQVEEFRREKGLPDRFFLFLGTLEPRKNLTCLIDAFALLDDHESRLILVGAKGWMVDDLSARVQSLGLAERVSFAGYAPDDELPLWYNAATVFVYPSRYEGFGMPPLEALACGSAVVTSNAASLPEAVGDAALMVEPQDVAGLAKAMDQLWTDKSLRAELSQRGIEHAKQFTWDATARATVESYRRVLGMAGGSI